MKTQGNIKKPEVSSDLVKTSQKKKKHRKTKAGLTAPFGLTGKWY